MKNLLAENMKRFGTKNLNEDIKTNSNFIETVQSILDGARAGDNMIDNILSELGDFYNDVHNSNDAQLKRLYTQLRMAADESPEIQAEYADVLVKYLGDASRETLDSNLTGKNIKTNPDFLETVETIMVGSLKGKNMTDYILSELGDYYTDINDSGDTKLKQLYTQLRMSADKSPAIQAKNSIPLFTYLFES